VKTHFGALALAAAFGCRPGAAASTVIPPDYFGMHLAYVGVGTIWPAAPIGSWRLHDATGTRWAELEPEMGKWNFRALDRYVALAASKRVGLTLTLGQTPRWASARPDEPQINGPGQGAEPRDLSDWERYVRTVARRYKGKIQHYEIWNEPVFSELEPPLRSNGKAGYYSGPGKTMIRMSEIAHRVLGEEDPQARIISPSFDGEAKGLERLAFFLEHGGGRFCDIIGFHFYSSTSVDPEQILKIAGEVRTVMRRYGIGETPLWNTEFGYLIAGSGHKDREQAVSTPHGTLSTVLDERSAQAYIARALIIGAWAGLERFYWLSWDSSYMGLLGPPGAKREVNAAGRAWITTVEWLRYATGLSCEVARDLWICGFERAGERYAVAWTSGEARTLRVPAKWSARRWKAIDGTSGVLPADQGTVKISALPVLLW
jgi:hypothetical protein